jgi:hypothetical protein
MLSRLIFILLAISIISSNSYAAEGKYFNVVNLNMRTKPSLSSSKVITIKQGSILTVIEKSHRRMKIDVFNDYWYKISFNNKIGWVYGGYIVKHINQNINEFIKRYRLIRYFKDGKLWGSSGKDNNNITCDLYLGFSDYTENLNDSSLELNLQVSKDTLMVFSITIIISDFYYKNDRYYFHAKTGRKFSGELTGSWKEGDIIASFSVNNAVLKIHDIIKIVSKRHGKHFDTQELMNIKLYHDTGMNYWQKLQFE